MTIDLNFLTKLSLLLLFGALSSASASNLGWLQDSAISKMTTEDVEIQGAAVQGALDDAADGESRRWENPETGANGVVTPVASFEQDGMSCRRVEVRGQGQRASSSGSYVFCRQADGTWLAPAAPSP